MFSHLFVYRLKTIVRDRSVIFWTLMFPLVLACLFKLAFGNLQDLERFQPIEVGVIENDFYKEDRAFQETLESLSQGESPLLALRLLSEEQAASDLKGDKIEGIIEILGGGAADKKLIVASSGLGPSILKSFLEQYAESQLMIERIAKEDPARIPEAIAVMSQQQNFRKEITLGSQSKQNPELNYFYSLLGMACMYGAFFGTNEVNAIQANLTARAARVNLVPVHKLKVFLYSGAAALAVQIVEIMILIGFIHFVLQIDFGSKWLLVLLTAALGSFVGVSFGAFISAVVKGNEGLKIALIIGVSMLGSMLSGMMFSGMKYLVAAHFPVLQYINPVSLVTDSFYTLYFFDDYQRFSMNLAYLVGFAVLFSLGTYWMIRGRKYASL